MRIIILSISSHMTEDEDETFRAYADSITGIFAADDEIDEMDKALAIADTPYTQDTVNFFYRARCQIYICYHKWFAYCPNSSA